MKITTLNGKLCMGIIALSLAMAPNVFAFGYGYGAAATGGTTTFHVTNLNDSGTGSLRDALSAGGRNIVFDVSGTITIKSTLVIPSNTTLNNTAQNITVTGYSVSMSGANNIIIRNVRFRETTSGPSGKCSLQGAPCNTVMIDHCSIELGRWDCFEATGGSHDITLEYCIIGQGVDPQYFGALFDGDGNITLHHNLWIDNNNRNPKLKANSQYINNVIYNWCDAGGVQGGHSSAPWVSDFIGNYFIKGPNSLNDNWASDCTANDQWYHLNNYLDLDLDGTLNGTKISNAQFTTLGVTQLASQQYPTPSIPTDSAATAVGQAVAGQWGAQPIDSFDSTLIGYLKSYGKSGRKGP
jgi:pectate lyase